MACTKCKTIIAQRPPESILKSYPKAEKPCDCGIHDWVRITEHQGALYCRKCRVAKREIGSNPPCPGKPPWTE